MQAPYKYSVIKMFLNKTIVKLKTSILLLFLEFFFRYSKAPATATKTPEHVCPYTMAQTGREHMIIEHWSCGEHRTLESY